MLQINKIHKIDALQGLKQLNSNSIDCIMTSPPYWALRDYGTAEWIGGSSECNHIVSGNIVGPNSIMKQEQADRCKHYKDICGKCGAKRKDLQLGLEPTFNEYISKLCDIFDEAKRVLKDTGTCWVNIGDTYFGGGKGQYFMENEEYGKGCIQKGNVGSLGVDGTQFKNIDFPTKSLTLIPFRFAIEMINRGWILRNTIIWHKPNCMPSSAKDRFTVDFEYVFFFVKQKKYFFEAQYEPQKLNSYERNKYDRKPYMINEKIKPAVSRFIQAGEMPTNPLIDIGRNKRTVWQICPQPFPEAHFAVYPEELCETPLKSGCPEFVCVKCGKAREKIIDFEYKGATKSKYDDELKGYGQSGLLWNKPAKQVYKGLTDCNCNAEFKGGIVLDMFSGAGTTALVSLKQNKRFIGFEINQEYIDISNKRLKPYLEQTKLTEMIK